MVTQLKRPRGIWVPPLDRGIIRRFANAIREIAKITTPRLDALDFLERELHERGIYFDVVEAEEMGKDHGRSLPADNMILLREDVYEGLCQESGRDRFTVCHEIGHLILKHGVSLARTTARDRVHTWITDSEWQADNFAAEFLMPVEPLVRLCTEPSDVVEVFGVSLQAARNRWDNLEREGLLSVVK